MENAQNAEILYDHAVQSFAVERYGKIHRLFKLALFSEHVECQVYFLSEDMCL